MRYPKAQWLGNGQSGGSYTSGPFKVVLHTTETRTLPGYQSGATAPHLTFAPASLRWWQHTDLEIAARALRNESGGIQTNRDSALQVEIICYSAKNVADQVGGLWVGNLSDAAYVELREFTAWCKSTFGVNDSKWPGNQAFNYAQANAVGFRMPFGTWDTFNGVCGHQHVPENTHWDPGALNWSKVINQGDDNVEQVLRLMVAEAIQKGWLSWPDGGTYWLNLCPFPNDPQWRNDFEPAWNQWKAAERDLINRGLNEPAPASGGVTLDQVKEQINKAKITAG